MAHMDAPQRVPHTTPPAFSLALPYWASAAPRPASRRRGVRLALRLHRRPRRAPEAADTAVPRVRAD
jgi:hypothetical protein